MRDGARVREGWGAFRGSLTPAFSATSTHSRAVAQSFGFGAGEEKLHERLHEALPVVWQAAYQVRHFTGGLPCVARVIDGGNERGYRYVEGSGEADEGFQARGDPGCFHLLDVSRVEVSQFRQLFLGEPAL